MIADIAEYVAALKASAKFGPQVVCHKVQPEKEGACAADFPPLAAPLRQCLEQSGVQRLYTHQCRAITKILAGQDVLVATPTASGKSMIYNLPVLNDLFQEDPGHSLYLFPLKALAQDQYKVLHGLFAGLPEETRNQHPHFTALFDGDTSSYARRKIRENPPRVMLTNPEMLHLSMLPYHRNWPSYFGGLRYVVIDEVHSYRGVLGSHMAWVIRRLVRIAAHYGARPVFILLSATIGNPGELGRLLLDRPVEVIADSGAPQAARHMLFINPWDSAAYTASQLIEAAVKRGLRTIVYTQSRRMTELINMWTAPRLGALADKLSAYRAGFLPEERREIEKLLFSGQLLGVISTSALELGIDIGDLDLCILVGYPGSIMATWQRGGRVGRGRRVSATVLIGQEDALDQHFMKQPEDFFRRSPESAVLNPDNTSIMDCHLHCCAAELPIAVAERMLETLAVRQRVEALTQAGALLQTAAGDQWVSARKYPQRQVSLRGGGAQMAIIAGDSGEIIGEIDNSRGLKECHPGAVYLHRSKVWVVEHFDLQAAEVLVRRESPSYFTRPMTEKKTEILEVLASKTTYAARVSFGRVRVTEKVTGYQKRNNHTQKLVSTTSLDLPEQTIESEGLWLDIPPPLVTFFEQEKLHFMGAIHALEHAMIALFPLLVLCDRNDIGGISCPFHAQTEQPSIFVYDGYPGGVGLAREAFRQIDLLLETARQTIASCGCATGCPSCVHSPKCGSGNRPIDKQACLRLLEEMLKENRGAAGQAAAEAAREWTVPKPASLPQAPPAPRFAVAHRMGLEALPARYGVFDLETMRSAEEVGGWHQAHRMGVSVAVVFDSAMDDYVTYLEHEIDQLIDHLSSLDLVVGFNNKRFDNRVLSGYTAADLSRLPSLDLLEEVHNYLGYRLRLDSLAAHTLGTPKTADGLQALQWYKEGRLDLIRQYCRKDVEITRNLLLHGLAEGFFLFTNKSGQKVRLPLALDRTICGLLDQGQSNEAKIQPVVPLP